jgi:DNA-binding NarL/FixJ family response regulator
MRCLIVDDHKVVSAGLSFLIKGSFPDWRVDVAATVAQAKEIIGTNGVPAVDLLLLDLGLGGESGLDLLEYLNNSKLENPLRSLVISGLEDQASVEKSKELGADGYLLKNGNVDLLMKAIRDVLLLEAPAPVEAKFFDRLPERQRAVFDLVMHAYPNKKIAQVLGTMDGTVKNQMSTIMRVAGVTTRAELMVAAERCGYVKKPIDELLKTLSLKKA